MKFIKNLLSIRIVAIIAILSSVLGCNESVLEETPKDFLSTKNLYGTVQEMNQAIYALHERVRQFYYSGGRHTTVILAGKGSDMCYDGENPAGSRWLTDWSTQLTPTSNIASYYWQNSYEVIQYANVLISEAEAFDSNDKIWLGKPNTQNAIIAEAKFFRAWCYRMLVIMYGGVPLQTEPVEGVKTDFVRAPESQVFALIEDDLKFGAMYLPGRGEEEQPGRITKGAANHLLSEIYLAQGKFIEAIAAASAVIDDAGYALMQNRFGEQLNNDDRLLIPEGQQADAFYDLFRYGNQNPSYNTEAIWVMQIEPEIDGGNRYGGERMFGNAYYRIGSDPSGKKAIIGDNPDASPNIYLSTFGRGVSWAKPTNYLAYTIWSESRNGPDADIRNARHNIFRDWRYNNPNSPDWFGKKIDFVNDYPPGSRNVLNDTTQYLYPFFTKYGSPGIHFTNENRSGNGYHEVDRYAMRLSETYLLRAEAHLGNGSPQLAADDINVVRGRAKATLVNAGDVTIDYILDERAREFYSETFRLLTLMRLGKLVEYTIQYMDNPVAGGGTGAGIQPFHSKFPIPQSEIDLNISGVLEQNPGY
ncbi:RagB/SusD family nutrient uptake outer membrane protein [Gaetbulibacter sp. M240]|uniref:RagB/SusD family nutrient uptake outer membrane protein n=1 Tax=Gaetbulibacter sp. M240 TaxID=3126511 RepID=UPI00374E7141